MKKVERAYAQGLRYGERVAEKKKPGNVNQTAFETLQGNQPEESTTRHLSPFNILHEPLKVRIVPDQPNGGQEQPEKIIH